MKLKKESILMFDRIKRYFIISSKDRKFIFIFLSKGLKNGTPIKILLKELVVFTKEDKQYQLSKILEKILNDIEEKGIDFSSSLRDNGIITSAEYDILRYSTEYYTGLEFLIESNTHGKNLKYAILLLFLPSIVVSTLYFVFQPQLLDFVYQLLIPVNSVSSTEIPIPAYLKDRKIFGIIMFLTYFFCGFVFYLQWILKRKNPKLFFNLFPLVEKEFIINTMTPLLNLINIGMSPGKAISTLMNNNDPLVLRIYGEMNELMKLGNKEIHKIFRKYKMDKATTTYMKIGENTSSFPEALKSIIEYNKEQYNKTIKRLLFILPLSGELIMVGILLFPLINIIMLTTVGVMQFNI